MIGRVLSEGRSLVVRSVVPEELGRAVVTVFARETLPRSAILVPVRVDGHVAGVLAVYADKGPMFVDDDLDMLRFFAAEAATIMQVRQYRDAAGELAALREADRLKDEFMAVVSHELRTPLTAISGYSDILLRKLSGPLNERQERQVTGVRDASRRLLALINDLLDVSKLEAGTLDLRLEAVDAQAALQRAIAGTRVIAANKGVQLEVREPASPLPPVLADEERLQQILVNLLANAIKFTPQGGSVWVDVSEVQTDTAHGVQYRIHDTGVGLAPEHASRVWDRFYQAESSSTRRFGGAGLGLSIVRRLAELHGGKAEATSAGANQGSTFSVWLPSAADLALDTSPRTEQIFQRMAPVESPPPEPEVNGRGPRVLVVEDDVDIAAVLRTYLEADGYEVTVAADGQQAIQMARALQPFAITLDISLPKLDGWSVLNVLKREPATSRIPVVVVSIVDNKDFGMVLGASDYLVKPIDHERLRTVLADLVPAPVPGDGNGTVLVVDDDPALCDVLGSALSQDGWHVLTASDGEQALAAVAEKHPSAMVLDLMIPNLDGFDVLRAVRSDPSTRDLPIIVVTAKDLTEDDRQQLNGAAQRVILKHAMRLDELPHEIRTLLARHRERKRTDAHGGAGGNAA
jgi:signal transduction histidine kinase/DNA-binding response OmpR family regulator